MIKPLLGRIALALSLSLLTFSTVTFAADLKEWTVLVYLNGHNNLDRFGKMNIEGMSQVGSNDKINIIVQWASEANGDTKRLYVTKGGYDVVEDMAPADMGDYKTLIEFARWAKNKYPAKKYMIDVWNHGNGWHIQDVNAGLHINDISYDDLSGHHITTEQLGVAMGEIAKLTGQKVELYASDACLMAMAEVAGEMANSVKFFGGSQETEPGEGWPYQTFLARLAAKPTMDGGELAIALSQEYTKAYSAGGVYSKNEVTFSAFDLSKMDQFYTAVRALTNELKSLDATSLKSATAAVNRAQSFALPDYKDLADYLSLIKQAKVRVSDKAFADVNESLKALVLSNDVTPGFKKAHGLSVWLTNYTQDWDSYSDRYVHLNFNKQTGWADFLQTVVH